MKKTGNLENKSDEVRDTSSSNNHFNDSNQEKGKRFKEWLLNPKSRLPDDYELPV